MKNLLILALDGLMDSGLAITLDTLSTGIGFLPQEAGTPSARLLTTGYGKLIHTGAGMRMSADLRFKEVLASGLKPDWVILPGAGMRSEQEISARMAKKDALAAIQLLRSLASQGCQIAASCSSVFFLAEAGLLNRRNATMTWWLAPVFRARYPGIKLDETRMLVRDGPCLTAGAAFAQLDLALAVVTETMGASIAERCARYLLIDQRPSQARYMMQSHLQYADPTVLAAERWIDEHLSDPISVTELSTRLAVSAKTLARRIHAATGVSPVKFIQRRRLMRAVHLIETTAFPIDIIAARVGYQDSAALRKLVKREFGTTPGALR